MGKQIVLIVRFDMHTFFDGELLYLIRLVLRVLTGAKWAAEEVSILVGLVGRFDAVGFSFYLKWIHED